MKTYTILIDGKPAQAFRAKNDDEAARVPEALWGEGSPLHTHRPKGLITVRPATVDERQKWTWASVDRVDDDNDDEYETDLRWDPDNLVVPLGEEEE